MPMNFLRHSRRLKNNLTIMKKSNPTTIIGIMSAFFIILFVSRIFFSDYRSYIYEFLNYYRFSQPEIPFFRFIIETIQLFMVVDVLVIIMLLISLLSVNLKTSYLKKRGDIDHNLS